MALALWTREGGGERCLGRVLAPGWPEWVGSDGERLGWVVRDRLFLHQPGDERCWLVQLPDAVEGVSPSPTGWVCALGQGFVTVDPARAEVVAALLDDESDPVGTRAGRDAGVFLEAPLHRALQLVDGVELALPEGASRSRWLTPWGSGAGVNWVDGDTVYRLPAGGRVAALGRLRGTSEVIGGPGGACVVRGRTASLLVAPRGFGVEGPLLEAARISETGESAVASDAAGALEVRLADGKVLGRWAGRLEPVGFLHGEALVHDRATGEVRKAGGGRVGEGFCGAQPAMSGDALAGPGGRQWRIGDETPGVEGLVDGLLAAAPGFFVHADDAVALYVDGHEHVRIAVEEVSAIACGVEPATGQRWVKVVGAAGAVFFDGDGKPRGAPAGGAAARRRASRVKVAPPGEDSQVVLGPTAWPVPADHAIATGPGAWAWSDDGALYALE